MHALRFSPLGIAINFASGLLVVLALARIPVTGSESALPSGGPIPETTHAPAASPFVDRTLDAGLWFEHRQGDEALAGLDETLGSGACALDYDQDGWVDLLLVNGTGHTRHYGKPHWWQAAEGSALFRNLDGKHFENVTEHAGIGTSIWGMGCLASDLDNDGDTDVLLTGRGSILLYQNDGNGRFSNVTEHSGIANAGWATGAAAGDFDGDGLLDLYLANFIQFEKGLRTFEADSQFAADRRPTFDAALYTPQANRLLRNRGNLTFEDVTATAGVADTEGRSLAAIWQDLDEDGHPDLIVSNERGTGSSSGYRNLDGRRFAPFGPEFAIRAPVGTRGLAVGDLNRDGHADVVLANPPGQGVSVLFSEWQPRPSDGALPFRFVERSREIGVAESPFLYQANWTVVAQDFDNDGWIDLLLGNGALEPDSDAPRVPQGQPAQLFWNRGRGQFVAAPKAPRDPLADAQAARGSVFADFDNDGDIDVYLSHNNDPGQLLINNHPARHWLGLRLRGHRSNRDALGARVSVQSAAGEQTKSIASAQGFLSDGDKRLLFGLGEDNSIQRLTVRWPDGVEQSWTNLEADRYLIVEEGQSALKPLAPRQPSDANAVSVRSVLGSDEPGLRIRYLKLLLQTQSEQAAANALRSALSDSDRKVREFAIQSLLSQQSHASLALLTMALEDPAATNVVLAIEGFRRFEEEFSSRWLLRLFDHQDASVRAAISDCYAYFFEEEEAMVHRKYLALPHLIRLLDDPASEVRGAAARALAAAERYRGVHALIAALNDPDSQVQAEATRALGLIRQRAAVPAITARLADPHSSRQVAAQALIALSRLGEKQPWTQFRAQLANSGQPAAVVLEQTLIALAELAGADLDATAVTGDGLELEIRGALDDFETLPAPNTVGVAARMAALRLCEHLAACGDYRWAKALATTEDSTVRAAGLHALAGPASKDRASWLDRALTDADPAIRAWAYLQRPATDAGLLPLPGDAEARGKLLAHWAKFGAPKAAAILAQSTPADAEANRLGSACLSSNPELRELCLAILFAAPGDEHNEQVIRWLTDAKVDLDFRTQLLRRYAELSDTQVTNTLFAIAKSKKDPLRPAAIDCLLASSDPGLAEFAGKLAYNAGETAANRLSAIEYLVRVGHGEALAVLADH